jgi:glycosyltransferase involved in cell wall biosynthesis
VAPTIAVFMPTHRCRAWLARAIESVLAQTWSPADLYVVDDGSDDVDSELAGRFPTVTFVRMWERVGPYRSVNLLLGLTQSDFVAFHDADDWSHPERLAAQVALLDREQMDGCGTWNVLVDLNDDPIGFVTPPANASLALQRELNHPLLHPTTLYHRRVFDVHRGFDDYTSFGADTEFFWRTYSSIVLGNVERLLYRRTIRPESLTNAAETGIGSPQRTTYMMSITENAVRIRKGDRTPPLPGVLLSGLPVQRPPIEIVEWIRPGTDSTTLAASAAHAAASGIIRIATF